jgi:hypothetical protein
MVWERSLVNVLKTLVLAFLLVYVLSTYPITAMREVSGFNVISICLYVQILPTLWKGCEAALHLPENITLFSITYGYHVQLYRILPHRQFGFLQKLNHKQSCQTAPKLRIFRYGLKDVSG